MLSSSGSLVNFRAESLPHFLFLWYFFVNGGFLRLFFDGSESQWPEMLIVQATELVLHYFHTVALCALPPVLVLDGKWHFERRGKSSGQQGEDARLESCPAASQGACSTSWCPAANAQKHRKSPTAQLLFSFTERALGQEVSSSSRWHMFPLLNLRCNLSSFLLKDSPWRQSVILPRVARKKSCFHLQNA